MYKKYCVALTHRNRFKICRQITFLHTAKQRFARAPDELNGNVKPQSLPQHSSLFSVAAYFQKLSFAPQLSRHSAPVNIKYITTKISACNIALQTLIFEIRQLAILADLGGSTTFAVDELNFCVRNGNRWDLVAIITGMAIITTLSADINKLSCPLFRGFFSHED